jgi:hypothetical protein
MANKHLTFIYHFQDGTIQRLSFGQRCDGLVHGIDDIYDNFLDQLDEYVNTNGPLVNWQMDQYINANHHNIQLSPAALGDQNKTGTTMESLKFTIKQMRFYDIF